VAIDRNALELKAVAPILCEGALVAPCTFVTSGTRTVGVASGERLRTYANKSLVIGANRVPVASWKQGWGGFALVEPAGPLAGDDLAPLDIAMVSASLDTRGAPAVLVGFTGSGADLTRTIVQVDVDAIDGSGLTDAFVRLASPREANDFDADGAALFAWFPAEPALGRKAEVVLVAMGITYRRGTFKPRALPAVAELVGLVELGRALAFNAPEPEARDKAVVGEIG
jgi:hypothetical protein